MNLEPVKIEDLFTELGKNSQLIKLTVDAKKSITKEVGSIPGYESTVTGDVQTGFVITNSLTPE